MKLEEFNNSGHLIIENDRYTTEVRYRASIGCTYYGILPHIRVIKTLFYIVIYKFHSDLVDKNNIIDSILGSYLKNSKEYRKDADYRLNKKID